jgi:hypothetical protein
MVMMIECEIEIWKRVMKNGEEKVKEKERMIKR